MYDCLEFIDVGFRGGIDLSRQVLPSGSEYLYIPDAAKTVAEARRYVIAWKDLEFRRLALLLVKQLEDDIANGQRQLFFKPSNFGGAAAARVFELLRSP